jgi:hypothetical protein
MLPNALLRLRTSGRSSGGCGGLGLIEVNPVGEWLPC